MPLTDEALICAFDFDSEGGPTPLSPSDIDCSRPDAGWRWMHCERLNPVTRRWIEEESGLAELPREALLDEETRPRVDRFADGTLLILRGVNLNPGAEPEDMVALRLWIRPDFILSLRRFKVFAVQAIRDEIEAGARLPSPARFMERLIEGLTIRLADTVEKLDDQMDVLEMRSLERDLTPIRAELTELRRDVIDYRRFLVPQREAVAKLLAMSPDWLDEAARAGIGEALDDLTRITEMLESIRDRSALLQEALASRAAEDMNRAMYVLSIVGAIFLPLGFLTGLLGINVGGIPGAESSLGFAAVCAIVVGIVAFQLYAFRRMGWF